MSIIENWNNIVQYIQNIDPAFDVIENCRLSKKWFNRAKRGFELPEDYLEWIKVCNGTNRIIPGTNSFGDIWIYDIHFASEQIPLNIENHRKRTFKTDGRVNPKGYSDQWFAVAGDGETVEFFIDFDPASEGTTGQIACERTDTNERFVVCDSIDQWFALIAECFLSGKYLYNRESKRFFKADESVFPVLRIGGGDAAPIEFDYKRAFKCTLSDEPKSLLDRIFRHKHDMSFNVDEHTFELIDFGKSHLEWETNCELMSAGDLDNPEVGDPRVKSVAWSKKWIPIAANGAGDLICVDLDPTRKGNKGQVIYVNHEGEGRTVVELDLLDLLASTGSK